MNPLDLLNEYLARVEGRLRALTLARGLAIGGGAALGGTVLAVLLANAFAFAVPWVAVARVLLFLALGLAIAFGILAPLARLGRRHAARVVELRHPEFEQRLLTITERSAESDPFLPLLAADSLRMAEQAQPEDFGTRTRVAAYSGLAAACVSVLAWLAISGPGFLGYGTSLMWGGVPKGGQRPFYDISVEPGSRTVRRRADQLISARLIGFQAPHVRVMARFNGSAKWEEAEMRRGEATRYEFVFAGLPDSLDYYVIAGGVRSKQYRLSVADLPSVKRIRVTYRFPAWTGMKPETEDPGGDLRAVEGTSADLTIETDRPLANGALLLDDGRKLPLREEGNLRVATVPIEKDGSYHIAAVDQGDVVRLSEDYFIEAQQDRPPTVKIARPGRDARVNPIEEVTVAVEGKDDFGLRELTLHYSVNAGPEKAVSLLPRPGERDAKGSTVLSLEDFKLVPGDVVSMYATARDARATTNTDIFFVEAQPFERTFRQSQQAGGGGGGGDQDDPGGQISQRQKEIIAATWNQIRDTSGDKGAEAENAKFLAGVQSKLRDQARSLVNRMRSRELAGAGEAFRTFTDAMDKAIQFMGPASDKLGGREWRNALEPEQKALQQLLRAEATFRDIQVAFGNRQGGGGGGGGNQGRDLEGLFDLELDTEKNQYESAQGASDQRQKEVDEALAKLEQLARRQQELAEQQKNNPQQISEQRWRQEMLRREAEQLRRQLEQMQRGGQQSQSGQMSQSGQASQSGQMSRRQQPGQSGGQTSQQLDRAISQVDQALRNMRESDARNAARQLQQAQEALSGMQRDRAGREMDDLVRRADQLAAQQRDFNNRLRQAVGAGQTRNNEQLAGEKDQMTDSVKRMESDMQRTARGMSSTEREASNKLRDALAGLQQDEVAGRMKWSAEAIRRGLGQYAVMREQLTTQALDNLRQQLRDAQQSLQQGQNGQRAGQQGQRGQQQGQGGEGDRGELARALAETQRLREQMERAGGGQNSGSFSAMNRGDRQGRRGGGFIDRDTGEAPRTNPEALERSFRDNVRGIERLGGSLGEYPEITRDLQEMIGRMRRIDPSRFPGNPALLESLNAQMLRQVADVELELRRRMDQSGQVRTTGADPAPPGYADAVAEYFRKLSKQK